MITASVMKELITNILDYTKNTNAFIFYYFH